MLHSTDHPELIPGVKPYYHDGRAGIAIYHADCRDVLPLIPDGTVDIVLTDPPYGHNNNDGDLIHHREQALGRVKRGVAIPGQARPIVNDSPEASAALVQYVFAESKRLLKRGCCCCCCCCGGGGPDPQFARWSLWLDRAIGFKHAVVWDKGGLGMGWHYRRNYELILIAQKPGAPCKWNGGNSTPNIIHGIRGIIPQQHDHPTPKPVDLMRKFIWLHSHPNDLVLDPLAGTCPVLVAAKQEGRHAIGIEIEERYCEIAAKRLTQEVFNFDGATVP